MKLKKILKYALFMLFTCIVWKTSSISIYVDFLNPKKSNTLYSEHLVIANIFLGTAGVHYRQVWLYEKISYIVPS